MTVQIGSGRAIYPLAFASVGGEDFNPQYVDYGNPTFLNLNNTGKWNPLWVVFPENYTSTDWVRFSSTCDCCIHSLRLLNFYISIRFTWHSKLVVKPHLVPIP